MIEIRDTGVILSVKPFQEKFLIVKCFSENNGIISGLIRINKKKNENIPGNTIFFHWRARLNDQLGYLKIETLNCIFSDIIFDKNKVSILNSTIAMLELMLKDREVNKLAYLELMNLLKIICINDILSEVYRAYVNFEKKLLSYCGYGLDWTKCAVTNSRSNLKYISPKTGNAVTAEVGAKYKDKLFKLPNFLINNNIEACKQDIIAALNLVGYFFEKFVLNPNYIKLPEARIYLIKYMDELQ